MLDKSLLEKELGIVIQKLVPINTVNKEASDDRNVYIVVSEHKEKFFAKLYSSRERYMRDKKGLLQFSGIYTPKVCYHSDNSKLIVTEYIEMDKNSELASPKNIRKARQLLKGLLALEVDRELNHYDAFDKYYSYLSNEKILKMTIDKEKTLGLLHNQPKTGCHGDFHPKNIIVSTDSNMYIVDFESSCYDFPLLDAVRFCYSPYLKIPLEKRETIFKKFTKALENQLNFSYDHNIINATVVYWALTCGGFYSMYCKADTLPKNGKYNYILDYCLKVIERYN